MFNWCLQLYIVCSVFLTYSKRLHSVNDAFYDYSPGETDARKISIDFEHCIWYIFVTVVVVIQIVVVVMWSQQWVKSSHFISYWDWHTRSRIFRRFLVTNPQRVRIFLLSNLFFVNEFVATLTQHIIGSWLIEIGLLERMESLIQEKSRIYQLIENRYNSAVWTAAQCDSRSYHSLAGMWLCLTNHQW